MNNLLNHVKPMSFDMGEARLSTDLIHHGGRFGVTGSCHELKLGPAASLLVDCGLLQGVDARGTDEAAPLRVSVPSLKAVLLTHAHIDHCGRLPHLLAGGYSGSIFCTEATALLLPIVLEDALKLGMTADKDLVRRFLRVLQDRLVPLPYGQWKDLGSWEGVAARVRFQQAGHILGSASVEVEVSGEGRVLSERRVLSFEQAGAEAGAPSIRVVFSGDLGAPDTPLLPDPVTPERADLLVLESTYGDRAHEDREGRSERLRRVVRRALRNRGAILVPAFSIGRTQELLYELEELIATHRDEDLTEGLFWDDLEIVIDSPMARRVTEIYRQLQPLWDAEAKQTLAAGRNPLSFEQMTVIGSHAEHLQTVAYLRKSARPCIVIAGSGMCAGGRIMNYLKALLEDERTDILFVGYQSEGTPGRQIQEQGTGGFVGLDGKVYRIRAGVHTIGGYSAHADQRNLIDFVKAMPERPGAVRLVHGEERARKALAKALRREVGVVVEE